MKVFLLVNPDDGSVALIERLALDIEVGTLEAFELQRLAEEDKVLDEWSRAIIIKLPFGSKEEARKNITAGLLTDEPHLLAALQHVHDREAVMQKLIASWL